MSLPVVASLEHKLSVQIVASVSVTNVVDRKKTLRCDALVDTRATFLVLPTAWKERLGNPELIEQVQVEIATQEIVVGDLCGPVEVQIEGFRRIHTDVLFVEMHPTNGVYEPLIGYVVLEQSQAAVDMVGHRLLKVHKADLK